MGKIIIHTILAFSFLLVLIAGVDNIAHSTASDASHESLYSYRASETTSKRTMDYLLSHHFADAVQLTFLIDNSQLSKFKYIHSLLLSYHISKEEYYNSIFKSSYRDVGLYIPNGANYIYALMKLVI